MSVYLYAIGRWCFRRRKTVLAAWLALLALLSGSAALWSGSFEDDFEIPGSSSQEALEKLKMTFPQGAALTAMAVVVAPEGDTVDEYRQEVEDAVAEYDQLGQVEAATSPWHELVNGLISHDRQAAIIQLNLQLGGEVPTPDDLEPLNEVADRLEASLPAGSQVEMGGDAYNTDMPHLSIVEAIGLVVALVVLTVVLGSLVAAGLPVLTAVSGVAIAMALMMLLTNIFTINSTTPLLSVMLGLAVGIDYALFILSRYRDLLREGMEPEQAAGRAVGTAGSAVVFAGLTVFIALLALGVANIPFLTVMGVFAAVTVVFAVVIALTMLPAFMGLLGQRMRPKRPQRDRSTQHRLFSWWVGVVIKRPVVTIAAVTLLLAGLTIPAVGLRVALPNPGHLERTASARITYDLLAQHFGPGFNGPLIVTADIIGSTDPLGLVANLKEEIEDIPGVASVPLATPNQNADTGLIQVIPTTASDDPATASLVEELRDQHDRWQAEFGVSTSVTGINAVQIDASQKLSQALVPFGVVVVGLSLVLLACVFRSVWVPIKATLGYLLSVGAAFGATTLVFNHGFLKEIVNVERGLPVISFLPILLMGILFGLAMDYEVFLVSRIREEYVHGATPTEAIRLGFVSSGPVIFAAAVIMFAIFAFFVPTGTGAIKSIAFALAIGVAADAFLVRMTLGPAVMTLLGRYAWWLPGWCERLLPKFDVEGETLTQQIALRDWPGDDSVLFADELAVAGITAPLSLRLVSGNVIGLTGPVGPRTGAALVLSGRLASTSGQARVAGALLPQAAAQVRRRVGYLDLAHSQDIAADLATLAGFTLVFIDSVEHVSTASQHEALTKLIAHNRLTGAVVLCAASPASLEAYDPDATLELTPEEVSV